MLLAEKTKTFNCCKIMIKNKVSRQSVINDINVQPSTNNYKQHNSLLKVSVLLFAIKGYIIQLPARIGQVVEHCEELVHRTFYNFLRLFTAKFFHGSVVVFLTLGQKHF